MRIREDTIIKYNCNKSKLKIKPRLINHIGRRRCKVDCFCLRPILFSWGHINSHSKNSALCGNKWKVTKGGTSSSILLKYQTKMISNSKMMLSSTKKTLNKVVVMMKYNKAIMMGRLTRSLLSLMRRANSILRAKLSLSKTKRSRRRFLMPNPDIIIKRRLRTE